MDDSSMPESRETALSNGKIRCVEVVRKGEKKEREREKKNAKHGRDRHLSLLDHGQRQYDKRRPRGAATSVVFRFMVVSATWRAAKSDQGE